jgi:hypothetical protein
MKTYEVLIVGNQPLLQHRFSENSEKPKSTRRQLVNNLKPRDEAEKYCYRDPQKKFFHPSYAMIRLLAEAGSSHKQVSNRKSLKYVIAGSVRVLEEALYILDGDGKHPVKDYEVDSRPVVIPATKGRIMRHRPRFDDWSMKFHFVINDDIIDPAIVLQLLQEGGLMLGIGDYRPEKFGPFGVFQVTLWKEINP